MAAITPAEGLGATMPELLRGAAARFGDRPVVITKHDQLTYAELEADSRRLAASLVRLGCGRGSRIAFLLPNGTAWVVAFAAITRIGAIALPASTFYRAAELRTYLRHADAEMLLLADQIGHHSLLSRAEQAFPGLGGQQAAGLRLAEVPRLRSAVLYGKQARSWAHPSAGLPPGDEQAVGRLEEELRAEDVFTIIYTSGSTSEPKGVVHGHGPALRHAAQLARMSGLTPADRIWTPLPLFWVGGLSWCLLRPMTVGAALVTQEIFDPGLAVDLIEKARATTGDGWLPAMGRVVQAAASRPAALATITGGDLRTALDAKSGISPPGMPLGMTETFGPHTYRTKQDDAERAPHREEPGGRPMPDVEHRIIDPETGAELPEQHEGMIAVRGDNLMLGLYRRARTEVFNADGWFLTGDRGYRDGEWITFTGRANDMIKTGGSNVAPEEVEPVLLGMPCIDIAFVVGVPSADDDEDVVAVVVPAAGRAPLDGRLLRESLASRLSYYKVPRHFVEVTADEVPWLASMKPDRRGLRDLAARRIASADGP